MPTPAPTEPTEPPPLGSWPRVYVLVGALAAAVMAALWWFTERFHVPLGPP
ncbi:MAG: hypothetical protein KF830_13930 [Planctomycetes bacterium]|nr:hypothetical protein [Planctomycetota bacterium]